MHSPQSGSWENLKVEVKSKSVIITLWSHWSSHSSCHATLSPIPLSPHQCSFGPCDYRVFLEGGKSASLCEGIRLFLCLPWWPHILRRLINWSLDVWQAFRAAANAASQIGRSCTVPEMKPVKTFPLWQEEVKIVWKMRIVSKSIKFMHFVPRIVR